jgi:hypothetical protein
MQDTCCARLVRDTAVILVVRCAPRDALMQPPATTKIQSFTHVWVQAQTLGPERAGLAEAMAESQ